MRETGPVGSMKIGLFVLLILVTPSGAAKSDDEELEKLVGAVASADQSVSDFAIRRTISEHRLLPKVLDRLVQLTTSSKQVGARLAALSALSAFRELARSAIPSLIARLEAEVDGQVRGAIAVCLATIGDADPAIVAAITERLPLEAEPEVRTEMLRALALMVGDRSAALPTLVSILKRTQDHRVRALTVAAMKGPWAIGQLPLLVELVSDPHDATRHNALLALGSFGEGGRPALPKIEAMRRLGEKNQDHMLEADCSMAIEQITGRKTR